MAALLDTLDRHLDRDVIRLLEDQIGASEEETWEGVAVALPLLVAALAAEVRDDGPAALDAALAADHDGTVLDHLTDILHRSARGTSLMDAEPWMSDRFAFDRRAVDGDGILGHLLGDRRERVAVGISRVTSLQAQQVDELLVVLAPVVMSALGTVKRERELDAEGLRALLSNEHHHLEGALAEQVEGEALPLLSFLDAGQEETIQTTTDVGTALREAPDVREILTHRPA